MISLDEGSLICDFAQYYNIYDYKALPLRTVGVLAVGLPEDSRIKLKMNDLKVDYKTMLLGIVADRLGLLIWQNSGADESHKPDSITQSMMGNTRQTNNNGFDSAEEYERFRANLIGKR
jgi:hypothetical protein